MLTQTERPSTRILALVLAFVTVGMIGLAIRATTDESTSSSGRAELTIGGTIYEFAPSTCTVSGTDFLAAGTGQIDGEDFWISVSADAAEVAIGTDDERIRSDDGDDLWLMNDGPIEWKTTAEAIQADLTMRNEREPNAPLLRGRFTATCSS